MRVLVAVLCIWLLPMGVQSQSMPAVYLNARDEEVIPDSATHYRIIDRKTEAGYTVRDYALNGVLLLRGNFISTDPPLRSGLFTWFHPNGAKASQVHFN